MSKWSDFSRGAGEGLAHIGYSIGIFIVLMTLGICANCVGVIHVIDKVFS